MTVVEKAFFGVGERSEEPSKAHFPLELPFEKRSHYNQTNKSLV